MPILSIPVMAIFNSGMHHELYMAERLLAAGAPIEITHGKIERTGRIIQQDDKDKKNIIFSWESKA